MNVKNEFKAISVIAILYLIIEMLGITCPIKFLTGISCAGCGMSRAWLAFIRGDFQAALYYHPLFGLAIPLILLILFGSKLKPEIANRLLIIICLFLILVYFIRLIFYPNEVVCYNPREGIIYKIFLILRRMLC